MSALFDCTAYKLMCSELPQCGPRQPGGEPACWRLPDTTLPLRVVWLQGTVTRLLADGDVAVVDDDTGTLYVRGCAEIPGGTGWLRAGEYCMVVGELVSVAPAEVKAIKMTPLGELHRRMWPLEVKHARRHLAGLGGS